MLLWCGWLWFGASVGLCDVFSFVFFLSLSEFSAQSQLSSLDSESLLYLVQSRWNYKIWIPWAFWVTVKATFLHPETHTGTSQKGEMRLWFQVIMKVLFPLKNCLTIAATEEACQWKAIGAFMFVCLSISKWCLHYSISSLFWYKTGQFLSFKYRNSLFVSAVQTLMMAGWTL